MNILQETLANLKSLYIEETTSGLNTIRGKQDPTKVACPDPESIKYSENALRDKQIEIGLKYASVVQAIALQELAANTKS